jgi:hypothetical protein
MTGKTLLQENNVISLRTAYVYDSGTWVSFRLEPADVTPKAPKERRWCKPQDFEWLALDSTWLYRRPWSVAEELKMKKDFPYYLDHSVKPMSFEGPPKFKLDWSDSGHSVALYLNGEPWAFIDETSHEGFSKGILDASLKNPWDQKLFEKIFGFKK